MVSVNLDERLNGVLNDEDVNVLTKGRTIRREDFPHAHETESLIAQQLANLSMRDREQVYYDVHGVADEVKETPELIAGCVFKEIGDGRLSRRFLIIARKKVGDMFRSLRRDRGKKLEMDKHKKKRGSIAGQAPTATGMRRD